MTHIQPKNWADFQHYKDRSPTWIKLHKSILDNYEFQCLPLASRALAPMLWLLASEYDEGKIPADLNRIAFRVRTTVSDLEEAIKPLISSGFFVCYQGASELIAECLPREENINLEEKRRGATASPSPTRNRKKGTRLPDDWKPSDELLQWAKAERPDLTISATVANFCDYWASKAGEGGAKMDWDRTFKIWVRRETARPVDTKQNPVRPVQKKPPTPEEKAQAEIEKAKSYAASQIDFGQMTQDQGRAYVEKITAKFQGARV